MEHFILESILSIRVAPFYFRTGNFQIDPKESTLSSMRGVPIMPLIICHISYIRSVPLTIFFSKGWMEVLVLAHRDHEIKKSQKIQLETKKMYISPVYVS